MEVFCRRRHRLRIRPKNNGLDYWAIKAQGTAVSAPPPRRIGEIIARAMSEPTRPPGDEVFAKVEKLFRDAAFFLHMDATVDVPTDR
jgi:hypothetical protein